MAKISHKESKDGTVCGAHNRAHKHPLFVELYWSHTTCKTCLKLRPPVKPTRYEILSEEIHQKLLEKIRLRRDLNNQLDKVTDEICELYRRKSVLRP